MYFDACYVANTFMTPKKKKGCQFDIFVRTGGTISCHKDNLQRNQRQQNCQIYNPFLQCYYTYLLTNCMYLTTI